MDKEQKQELIANSQGPIDQDGEPVNPRFHTSAAVHILAPSPNLLCRVGDNYTKSPVYGRLSDKDWELLDKALLKYYLTREFIFHSPQILNIFHGG